MAIRTSDSAPRDGHRAIALQLGQFIRANPMPFEELIATDLQVTDGYRTYMVNLDSLASGSLLSAARAGHWRYLVVARGEAIAEVDVETISNEVSRVVALHRGPGAGGTARALAAIAGSQADEDADYEPRLLEAPGIFFVALWLAAEGRDLIVPIEPDQSSLPLYEPLTEEQALPVLRRRAAEVLEMQRENPGPSGA